MRAKLYAIIAALGSALLAALYWLGKRDEHSRQKRREFKARIREIKRGQEVQNDVESLDDGELRERASRYVRKDK